MSDFKLHPKQRSALEQFIAHSPDARLVVRAYALLWLDEEAPIQEIAQSLRVSRQTVYNWARRFEERQGLALELRLADAARSGRPATAQGIIDPLIEAVIDLDPRRWSAGLTSWTRGSPSCSPVANWIRPRRCHHHPSRPHQKQESHPSRIRRQRTPLNRGR